jgi:hypothetical protein
VRSRYASHRQFSTTTIEEVLGPSRSKAREVQAVCLASLVLLQRGDRFEVRPLPFQAQAAPAFGACVADLDGDGREDLFLSQNYFALNPVEPRLDAGRSLWLRGDGKGNLEAVPGQSSGLKIYGEQRGAAVGDFDEDGRPDLVVAQNRGATMLYHNLGATPGVTVRLAGSTGNPAGIGASLRLLFGSEAGPVREVHGGSGYWSQDSVATVLAAPRSPSQVWVRWPGGRVTTNDWPQGVRSVVVDTTGKLSRPAVPDRK